MDGPEQPSIRKRIPKSETFVHIEILTLFKCLSGASAFQIGILYYISFETISDKIERSIISVNDD